MRGSTLIMFSYEGVEERWNLGMQIKQGEADVLYSLSG